ncbi:flagellin N-terminal helical domain-containing protein [Rhodobium gokarnense]|uniref:Flagellin n=1 Tax=Rhodobium gokarnense TaxID=364296 RepID=A0ABT3HD22_9HYPH|nr:flagellin [Rhodobium gokarnense]MCW2308312.1 flagellin-like hook-associated protein FlgL [Rhodobium gokarnense]
MSSEITLSAGVRQNLLSLQNTADMMATTQSRLATGKKVNSALDNPTNFFTSQSLNNRASDLSSLLDSMSNGMKTLEAADNGLTSMTNTLESMQSTLRQARQDKSFEKTSFTVDVGTSPAGTETLSLSDGAIGSTAVDIALTESTGTFTGSGFSALDFDSNADDSYAGTLDFDVSLDGATAQSVAITASDADTLSLTLDGGSAVTFDVADVEAVTADELADAVNALFDAESVAITASTDGGELVLTADTASSSDVASVAVSNVAETLAGASDSGLAGGAESLTNVTAKTVDTLVSEINASSSLDDKVRASNDNGSLRIENQSTNDLTVTGVTSGTIDGGTGTDTIGGNEVRSDLATQFNDLRDQLDKLSDDSSFNGINLLQGDLLTITFNETSTSTLDIQSEDGETINSAYLGLSTIDADALDSDTDIDTLISTVKSALGTIRSQASTFGSNLSMVENREDFTKNMINTLETGADDLVLADTNEEAANMLALQTRQQLSSTALSLASQADQAVLRLF